MGLMSDETLKKKTFVNMKIQQEKLLKNKTDKKRMRKKWIQHQWTVEQSQEFQVILSLESPKQRTEIPLKTETTKVHSGGKFTSTREMKLVVIKL